MAYLLKDKPTDVTRLTDGYYTGKTYKFGGETYAIVARCISDAKKYKTKKIAENVCNKLYDSVCNYTFKVVDEREEPGYDYVKNTPDWKCVGQYPNIKG